MTTTMPPPVLVDLPARRIAGIAIRTSFATVAHDAGAIWQRAFAEGIPAAAAGRPLAAVYAEYDTDFRGAYTMLVGAEVDAGNAAPPSYREIALPAGCYARFAADGDPAVAVAGVWQYINSAWPDRGRRAYGVDLELYGVRGPGTADIYVGVRS